MMTASNRSDQEEQEPQIPVRQEFGDGETTAHGLSSVLVTGAAGFIGARVAELLLDAGVNVVGIDNLNDYYSVELKKHRLSRLSSRAEFAFHPLDIEDRDGVERLFGSHSFEAVVNLAARAGVRASVENPYVYFSTNVTGTLNLLEALRLRPGVKFVMASTSSLYAGQEMPFVESMAVNHPRSPYAASKKAAEALAYSYHHLHGIDVSICRYFTVYGPAGRPDMSPYRFMQWIERGEPLQLYGDGTQQRDFTYIDDIARGTIAALQPLGFEIVNLGGNQPYSINHLIKSLEALIGKPARIQHLAPDPSDMPATFANIDKAKRLLHWFPRISLEEGLHRTWAWRQQYSGD